MRAALIKAFGEPSQMLELADVPQPSGPALGEVLIGVEYKTTHLAKIEYPAMSNRAGDPKAEAAQGEYARVQ